LHGLQLGVGTIKTITDAEIFIAAGADFIVCPIINPAVAEIARKAKLLWLPGCMTATELHLAESSGAVLVKIFPGNILGPSFVQAVKEIFPKLLFMPTGGVEVNKDNLQAWFNSGVSAVGMGSKLITKSILEKKEFEELTATTTYALQLIKECRK
jgi:2-dehydro-3-deoxyphosphogluconate aldolase/(4S)-4-hydroxy-2-oxoglutarate aldolase